MARGVRRPRAVRTHRRTRNLENLARLEGVDDQPDGGTTSEQGEELDSPDTRQGFPQRSSLWAWAILALGIALHLAGIVTYRIDSDETQHLHVVWAWSEGLAVYREVFDNHVPLFHLLSQPLFIAAGETSEIVRWMRLEMVPLWAAALWLSHRIAKRLFDAEVALWATAILSIVPTFLLKTIEVRNDNPWLVCWLGALAAIVLPERPSRRWLFAAGLLLGASAAFSLKSVVLVVSVTAGGFAVWWLTYRDGQHSGMGRGEAAAALAGFAVVPTAVAAYLAQRGVLGGFVSCVFEFNSAYQVSPSRRAAQVSAIVLGGALTMWVTGRVQAIGQHAGTRRRTFVAVTGGAFTTAVLGVWPIVTQRDFAPVIPLAAMFGTWVVLRAGRRNGVDPSALSSQRRFAVMLAAAALLVGVSLRQGKPWRDNTAYERALTESGLLLSRRGELLLDAKGESIFRRRPCFPIFERITRTLVSRGMVEDTIPGDLVAARCTIVRGNSFFPTTTQEFIAREFVNVGAGPFMVAGKHLYVAENGLAEFEVTIPATYRILTGGGDARGLLDGTPHAGSRSLAVGTHTFSPADGATHLLLVWAPAVERAGVAAFGRIQ